MDKPSDFISVSEAIALLDTDTRTNPTVDDSELIRSVEFLHTNLRGNDMNFRIVKVKRDESGKIVRSGIVFAKVTNGREASELAWAIEDHYKKLSGKTIDSQTMGLQRQATTVEESTNFEGRPHNNADSTIKPGDELVTGESTTMVGGPNGAN